MKSEHPALSSWQSIWIAVRNGKHSEVQRAINEHVEQFPISDQAMVRLRALHIVRDTQGQPEEVRNRIRRASRTMRILRRAQPVPTEQE